MILQKITGPECPSCCCRDSAVVHHFAHWGKPWVRRRCRYCRKVFSVAIGAPPAVEPEPQVEQPKPAPYQPATRPLCPECSSSNTHVTSSPTPIRYHKCRDCGHSFKTCEQ